MHAMLFFVYDSDYTFSIMFLEPVDTICPVPTPEFTLMVWWIWWCGAMRVETRPLLREFGRWELKQQCPPITNYTSLWTPWADNVRFATDKEINDYTIQYEPFSYLC